MNQRTNEEEFDELGIEDSWTDIEELVSEFLSFKELEKRVDAVHSTMAQDLQNSRDVARLWNGHPPYAWQAFVDAYAELRDLYGHGGEYVNLPEAYHARIPDK